MADDTSQLAAAVLDTLRRQTRRADLEFERPPTRLAGGFWADLIAFRLRDAPEALEGDLVARVMPTAEIAAKETAVQTAVAAQGYPTPRVRLAGGPDGPLGRAYMVMDLAIGTPLLAGLDGPSALVRLPSLARRLPRELALAAAQLHALDPRPARDALVGADVDRGSSSALLNDVEAIAAVLGHDGLIAAAAALRARQPVGEADVICHGDLHPFNVLIDPAGDFVLLDWSVSAIAPRTFDLGFTTLMLRHPPLVTPRALQPIVGLAGRWLARSFLRQYARASGEVVDPVSLSWHRALHALRALTELAGWAAGGTLDQHAGHPWLTVEAALVQELSAVTGVEVLIHEPEQAMRAARRGAAAGPGRVGFAAMQRIAAFGADSLVRCRDRLHAATQGAACMEEAAGAMVRELRGELLGDDDAPACPLVRFYCTQQFGKLPAQHQEFAAMAANEEPMPTTRCLTLLGSAGIEPEWDSPRRSTGHLAIPLTSEAAVTRLPMVAALFSSLGIDHRFVVAAPGEMATEAYLRDYEVFYVAEARGSAAVPAQKEFVEPYGIRSVLGLGGVLASGDVFALIMFSSTPVPAETLRTFRSLAIAVKAAVVPHTFNVFLPA